MEPTHACPHFILVFDVNNSDNIVAMALGAVIMLVADLVLDYSAHQKGGHMGTSSQESMLLPTRADHAAYLLYVSYFTCGHLSCRVSWATRNNTSVLWYSTMSREPVTASPYNLFLN